METCQSPRKVIVLAWRVGKSCLPPYASQFSRKDFTLPQLFACLTLRQFYNLSYRKTEALLRDSPSWRRAIGLKRTPDHNTLCDAFDVVVQSEHLGKALDLLADAFEEAGLFETKGKGHYIGNFLYTHSRYDGWWGEGDTIFHLDGKAITHTPGTEDEYGSCWGFEKLYSYLDSGYIEMENGRNRMYRWYYANPVRFKESLKVEVQNQRLEDGQVPSKDDYVSIAYWYQDEPQPVALLPYKQRVAPSEAAEYPKKP